MENAPKNKTQTLKKNVNMDISVVNTLTQPSTGGSYTEIKFKKK